MPTIAAVGLTFGLQPEITPSSLAKMNTLRPPLSSSDTAKPPLVLQTMPVGTPSSVPLADGILTTSGEVGLGTGVPSPRKGVAVPVPLSATHQGPVGLLVRPHGLTRFGSTRSARSARSE